MNSGKIVDKPACLSFSCSLDLPLETIFSTKYKYIKIGRRQLVVFKVHGGSKKIFGWGFRDMGQIFMAGNCQGYLRQKYSYQNVHLLSPKNYWKPETSNLKGYLSQKYSSKISIEISLPNKGIFIYPEIVKNICAKMILHQQMSWIYNIHRGNIENQKCQISKGIFLCNISTPTLSQKRIIHYSYICEEYLR